LPAVAAIVSPRSSTIVSTLMGKILSDLAIDGSTRFDISHFKTGGTYFKPLKAAWVQPCSAFAMQWAIGHGLVAPGEMQQESSGRPSDP
jgi:hypothetical protein